MEISSFLKMWMDAWNEVEEKGLKMPEEGEVFRKKEMVVLVYQWLVCLYYFCHLLQIFQFL